MKSPLKRRIDQLLVDRKLADSRQKAQALILAGQVLVDRQKVSKPGHLVPEDCGIELLAQLPFVSRGGIKLEQALNHWRIDVEAKVCLDIGASTGGFTDCLLQRGASRVYAVDVGATQLAWKLQRDARVIIVDHTNARHLQPVDIPELCHLAVCDVSFISITMILPELPTLLTPEGEMVILIKPQFEVGRGEVGKGGIVRDSALHDSACRKVTEAVESLGFRARVIGVQSQAPSNREFLLHASH
ncbi:MAG: TlyA family RNA methyltransferase [Bryobacteraceae bacterium]